MRTLLTGGLGFIGHHTITDILDHTDWELTVIDSYRHANKPRPEVPEGVRIFWTDLRHPIDPMLETAIGEVDVIINMASDSRVDLSIADPVPFVKNNVLLGLHMLEYARRVGARFVQVSTDEVYGTAPPGIYHTETDPVFPSNPYSASKAAQEALAWSYHNTYGVPLVTTRTQNNIGEWQTEDKFLPKTIRSILRGERVLLYGSETDWSSRIWMYAANHAAAIRHLVETGADGVWNVTGEQEINVYDLAQMVADILEIDWTYQRVDFQQHRPGYDLRYSLDGSKLAGTGWTPPVTLEDGLERTVEWYRKRWS